MKLRFRDYSPNTRRWLKRMFYTLLGIITVGIIVYISIRPSNDRDWSPDQAILPSVEIEGDNIVVHNVRNFTYRSTTDYTPAYYDATYKLSELKNVYYSVEPFSGYKGAAHTFLSFEFENDKFVSISVEIRKEKGEKFSAVKGLFKQFELMYVIADERDVVKLRTNYRKDQVYMYPIKGDPAKVREIFMSMINHIDKLETQPEFYNTIFNNCASSIAYHVNKVVPGRVPWSKTFIFPQDSDKHILELGLINTTETDIEKVRAQFNINAAAEKYVDDPEFSLRIRGR